MNSTRDNSRAASYRVLLSPTLF